MDDSIDDNAGKSFETGTDGTGYDTIDELPAGTYFIDMGVRNGTTSSFVWDCYDAAGASERVDPLMMGSNLVYALNDGAQVRCDWFNVVGGTGRVIVNSHACGILIPAYTLAYELLGSQCNEDPGTIEYTVVSDTFRETQPAAQNPLTLASFANVPSGYVAVVEDLPDGWGTPIVYCQVLLEDGTQVSPPAHLDVIVGSSAYISLEPGQVVSCDWFNVIGGFVDVHITTYACPEGVDPYAEDLTSLVVACTADPGIIEFTTEADRPYLQTRTATGAAPASFTDVPSGQLRIQEDLPAGYGLPVVYCRIDFEDGSNVVPAVRKTVGSFSSITQGLSAGQVLHCEWFNAPGGEGMVSIWTQSCPEGFDAQSATRLELELQCNEPIGTVDFGLSGGSFSAIASSTDLLRYADFNAVPARPLIIVEAPQEGYDDVVVYCRVQDGGNVTPYEKVPVSGGSTINWDLGPNQWLICEWYNAHDAGGTVVVHKYECPEGTTYDHDLGWYTENCTTPQDSIEFRLTHSGGLDPEFPANGTVEWNDVLLGPVSIQEYLPPEYGEPVVFCGVVSSSGGPLDAAAKLVESKGGYVETSFDYPNTRYVCYWYNIPGGPGEIIVHKYTCPPGYDLHAANADPRVDCTENARGISFTLAGAAANIEDTTGDDGTVQFDDLAPGPYTVTEAVPEGTDYVFVLDCYGQTMGELRPYPLSMGETLPIDVGAGEKIECYWYNVPDYDQGRLTVVKYQCSTPTFTSTVDCEVFEDGQTFDLVWWNGEAWEYHSTQATDGAGRTTFVDLTPGEYWLDEHDREWCHLTSGEISDDGNWLNVGDGGETVVEVFNCNNDPGAQGKPGETPAKYPNTGVPMNEPTP
ncbi:MAG: prealbumin-like fold domain-containing protein, partial [Actinomycetota bacterium]|nr:prealbumin-like fold domain-containing protein [Actinomycetota bacterium]